MSAPSSAHLKALRRIGRYLVDSPRLVSVFPWQKLPALATVYSDADWGGCPRSGRSTSGGVLMLGQHCMRAWASTQTTVALSSAEAELVALVRASTEALGFSQLCSEFRVPVEVQVFADASAALAVAARKGCGRMRHLRLGDLWIQEKARSGEVAFYKVSGERNPADLMTKHLKGERMRYLLGEIGYVYRMGSARARLLLHGYLFGPSPSSGGYGPRRGDCGSNPPWGVSEEYPQVQIFDRVSTDDRYCS